MIEKGKACLTPTNKPFWKYPGDVPSCVRTRSQEKNQKNVKIRDYDKYFKQKDIQRWLEADDSEVVFFLVVFIVNNGNVLTDGQRYRKRPKIEM